MKISLNVGVSSWRASDFDVELAGGRHDLPSDDVTLSAGLLRAIAAAAGAGVLEILDVDAKAAKVLDGAVEADEDSLVRYGEAVSSGAWLEGHLEDVVAQRERQLEDIAEQLRAHDAGELSLEPDALQELVDRAAFNLGQRDDAQARLALQRKDS